MFASRTRSAALAFCVACLPVACKQRHASVHDSRDRKSAALPAVTSGLFDLALGPNGPSVVRVDGRAIVVRGLSPIGSVRVADHTVYTTGSEIAELRALGVGERIAVAFVERAGDDGRLARIWLDRDGNVTEPKRDLGPTTLATAGARGNLALAARGAETLLFARGADERCAESAQRCAHFSFYRLDRPGDAELRRPPLSVPNPCPVNAALFAVTANRWYYSMCNEAGAIWKTTAFLIQSEPQYARADDAFSDCMPIGLALVDTNAVVTADCSGTRRSIELGAIEADPLHFDITGASVACRDGHPVLSIGATQNVSLDEPRADVAALLPASLLPREARALWTGRALVIAEQRAGSVEIDAYRCAGTALKSAAPHG